MFPSIVMFFQIASMGIKVGHFTAKDIYIFDAKLWPCVTFLILDIVFPMDLILGSSEMGVVRFLGVVLLEFEEFMSTYGTKNC